MTYMLCDTPRIQFIILQEKNITVIVEKETNSNIIGGKNSTQQYIHCDIEPTQGPYTVKAHVNISHVE